MTSLELTEKVSNEEAAKHQAHGQQGSVGVRPLDLQLLNGYVAVWMDLDVLHDDRVKGVVQRVVEMFVVEDQRVGSEYLKKVTRHIRCTMNTNQHKVRGNMKWMQEKGEETMMSLLKVS